MEHFKITLIDVIIIAVVLIIVIICTIIGDKKEKAKMSVETYRGMEGFTVDAESAEDVYNALDGMHTQTIDNMEPNNKLTMWLADKMDEMRQKFDLDEDELQEP